MSAQPRRVGRPRVSSKEVIEGLAFELLLRDGYEATTVEAITGSAGVGRTTLFRYFGSKSGIVYAEFDKAVERLRAVLDEAPDEPVMDTVRSAVVTSTRLSREAAPDTWLDRFRVLDGDPALVGETAAHWRVWSQYLTEHVAARTGLDPGDPLAAAVGGAVQAVYVAVLRSWAAPDVDGAQVDVDELDRALLPVADALQRLLDEI